MNATTNNNAIADNTNTNTNTNNNNNNNTTTLLGGANRLAHSRVRRGVVLTANIKAARMDLQEVQDQKGKYLRLVLLGGNASNALLARAGGSLAINEALCRGASWQDIQDALAGCPAVKHPQNKFRDHIRNMAKYAEPARLNIAGIVVLLRKAGITAAGEYPPAVCINGIPWYAVGNIVRGLLPTDVLSSPLLCAMQLAHRVLLGLAPAPTVTVRRKAAPTWGSVDVTTYALLPTYAPKDAAQCAYVVGIKPTTPGGAALARWHKAMGAISH